MGMRTALRSLSAAAVLVAGASQANAGNVSWNWGTNGSGACVAVDGVNSFFTPTNCQITVGPWWSARPVALTTKWIPCNETYYNNLEAWNYEELNGFVPIHGIYGIAYQTTSSAFTWDETDVYLPLQDQANTSSSPGSGGIGLQNWSLDTRHFQGAVACLDSDSPTKPSSGEKARPKVAYDFGAWEVTIAEDGSRQRVVKQVRLTEGRTSSFRLLCPRGTVRSGGVSYDLGHATKRRPDPEVAARTEVVFSASPRRLGAEVRLRSNRLPYPTVAQLSMTCKSIRAH